jgi:hypothetical protein
MGAFGNILMVVIAINVIFGVFGIVEPTNNLISALISDNSTITTFYDSIMNNLQYGAVNNSTGTGTSPWWTIFGVIGVGIGYAITKRDELIYGFLIYELVSLLGIFNFIIVFFAGDIAILGSLLRTGMIVLFTWSAIEWLRGIEK